MRAVLHTWCHGGEINAIRQMLGHPEIPFVMFMKGNMDWLPAGSADPAWVEYPPVLKSEDLKMMAERKWMLPAIG